jgi:hypothetical protein
MLVNLARGQHSIQHKFFDHNIRGFSEYYDFPSIKATIQYVKTGKQGLKSFVEYLNMVGYKATFYSLEPNKDVFTDVGDNWVEISRTSPSYGFTIPDDDPELVMFKLANM